MCIESEKDNFKSREVNCLKECALALTYKQYKGLTLIEQDFVLRFIF